VPMALENNWYLLVATAAALLGMALQSVFHRLGPLITLLDAITIGLFGALGTTAALAIGLPALPAIFVGVASAVGGGMLRDLFLNQPIAVMHVGSLYAVAAGAGSAALIAFVVFGMDVTAAGTLSVIITVVIRLLSVRFNLYVPEQRSVRWRRESL
ncbi:MAG: trimeric intracellular cation channel family protein, partial [Agromyces sp.]